MVGICALHLIVRHGQEGYCLIRWTRLVVGAALHALRMASIRATNQSRRLDSAQIFLKRVSVGAPNQFSSSGWATMQDRLKRAALGDRLFPPRRLFRPPRPDLLRRPVQPLVRRRHRRWPVLPLLTPGRCSREPRRGRAAAPGGTVLTFCTIRGASEENMRFWMFIFLCCL